VNRLAVAVAILLCIALGASPAAATHLTNTGSPVGPTVPWGFNEFWGFPGDGTWSGEQADLEIALANAIMPPGHSAHRLFVQWRRVEGTPNQYNWTVTDRAYQAMQGAEPQRKPVMVIHDAPDWARNPNATCLVEGCTFPPDPDHYDDWQQFVQDAVARYPNVRAVEVWNEPNLARFWGPAPDPARYVEVLARAKDGAKDAVASTGIDVPVITGALSPVRTTSGETPPRRISSRVFLREIYELGDKNDFEGIGTHPFTMSKRMFEDMWVELNRLFEVRDNHNDPGTPLWITEISVSSDDAEGVTPSRQGKELVRLYHSIEGHEIESFIIFRFHDAADGTPYSPYFKQTGVVGLNLAPKPAYCWLGAEIGTPCGKVAR
jgi:polysaccharide biosynthesis protein PslG